MGLAQNGHTLRVILQIVFFGLPRAKCACQGHSKTIPGHLETKDYISDWMVLSENMLPPISLGSNHLKAPFSQSKLPFQWLFPMFVMAISGAHVSRPAACKELLAPQAAVEDAHCD